MTEFDGIEFNQVAEKNRRLFDFSVERVLWVLSKHRRFMIAQLNQDWSNNIPVMESCTLTIRALLDEEGIDYQLRCESTCSQ